MMERQEILIKMQEIFREILDDENLVLIDGMPMYDIEGWDSLTHIQLIVEIENAFGVKFTAQEILSWKNVGEIISWLEKMIFHERRIL